MWRVYFIDGQHRLKWSASFGREEDAANYAMGIGGGYAFFPIDEDDE